MIQIFESILPIFAIVLLGVALRRMPFIDQSVWPGLETLGYYLLFPMLLFLTLATADFSDLKLGAVSMVALLSVFIMGLLLLALRPLVRANGMTDSRYTSLFQTSSRWNAFIALAIAEKIFGTTGLAIVALVMAVIIIPINMLNLAVLIWYGTGARNMTTLIKRMAGNPLILGCMGGLFVNALPYGLYPPLEQAIDLIARTALGLGLLMVGAGLQVNDALRPGAATLVSVALKLIIFPLIMGGLALSFGLAGETVMILVLCASVPTALNGYVLARQMGGDTQLYAAVSTVQTAASFITIPAAMWIAAAYLG